MNNLFATVFSMLVVALIAAAQLRAIKKNKKIAKIGISRFPDSLIVLHSARSGYFSPFDIKVIFLHWQGAYQRLSESTIDVLFGLTTITGLLKSEKRTLFEGHHILSLYQSFSIILAKDTTLLGYEETARDRPTDERIRQTVQQIAGLKICVMSRDTEASTRAILTFAGVPEGKQNVVLSRNFERDFTAFLNGDGDAEAFVGGVTQRLIAKKFGCKELISEQSAPLGLIETTQFVSHRSKSSTMEILENGWFLSINKINKDEHSRQLFISLMNQYCVPKGILIQFDLDDFKLFWNKWEIFADSPAHGEELARQAETVVLSSILGTPKPEAGSRGIRVVQ